MGTPPSGLGTPPPWGPPAFGTPLPTLGTAPAMGTPRHKPPHPHPPSLGTPPSPETPLGHSPPLQGHSPHIWAPTLTLPLGCRKGLWGARGVGVGSVMSRGDTGDAGASPTAGSGSLRRGHPPRQTGAGGGHTGGGVPHPPIWGTPLWDPLPPQWDPTPHTTPPGDLPIGPACVTTPPSMTPPYDPPHVTT